ncbi:MFS transporter [Croceicoccus sp. F390]|uniref:MFS transporter n=1 Tax=Croceicoccus esteveae TaxID=3075597 RepID=A0ABU2ZHN6_9SPHN|nr:MFS transporter [Croceicoccus sp. F390]MDT0575866.1 MFS transporter [Croceicoccus sp. F390]
MTAGADRPHMPDSNEKLTRSHVVMIGLLAFVVMFEGFDISTTSVVLPYLGEEFGATPAALGRALGIIAIGAILAFLTIRLSDRFGRKPVLIFAAAGFSLGSLATVLSDSVASYTAIQFVARLLMVTQVALAYIMVSETIPPRLRGRANGLLGACGSFGAALPFLLLEPALATAWGWRLLFVVGAIPLLATPLLIIWLSETPIWKAGKANWQHSSILAELRLLLRPELRSSTITMSLLWLIINFATSVSALFFTQYAVTERGWVPADFTALAVLGLAGTSSGFLLAGFAMDLIGRRWTITVFMVMLGALTQFCYNAQSWWAIAGSFVGLQAMMGVWVAAYTINSELFPTALRGAANGWCHNLLGRWGVVTAPWILGALVAPLGSIGAAATVLGFVAYLAVPLVWIGLPETRARKLDQPD